MLGVEMNGKLLALPLQATRFDTVVVGTVAETEVVQVFQNPFDEAIEAVYLFPLHERAAVDDYWMTIGERSIHGKMQTREQARETYEQAKEDGRTASLLEQQRPFLLTGLPLRPAETILAGLPGGRVEVAASSSAPINASRGRSTKAQKASLTVMSCWLRALTKIGSGTALMIASK